LLISLVCHVLLFHPFNIDQRNTNECACEINPIRLEFIYLYLSIEHDPLSVIVVVFLIRHLLSLPYLDIIGSFSYLSFIVYSSLLHIVSFESGKIR